VYAAVRKKVAIGGMPGLFVETVLLLPLAIAWFAYLYLSSKMVFADGDSALNFWLLMAGPITALPLLCFALAARRLSLTTIGFMQFLAPTIQFCTAIYFGEELTTPHVICFAFIWSAVGFFIYDALKTRRSGP
jgi:chloramphenicol-sensitive protein RarD